MAIVMAIVMVRIALKILYNNNNTLQKIFTQYGIYSFFHSALSFLSDTQVSTINFFLELRNIKPSLHLNVTLDPYSLLFAPLITISSGKSKGGTQGINDNICKFFKEVQKV